MVDAIKNVLELLRRSVVFGSVYGVPIRVEYSWFFVFILLVIVVAANIPAETPISPFARLIVSILTIGVFFMTLLAHELAHAFMARRKGIGVKEIHLHPFGGVATLRREPDSPGSELSIAIAGPLMSLLIAVLFGLGYFAALNSGIPVLAAILFVISLLNFFLAVFNMFPGFPLDGGRVLRAILRKRGMDLAEATALTAKFGQIIGAVGIFSGLFLALLNQDWLTGLWSALVGLYLFVVARQYVVAINRYENLIASDVMEMPIIADPELTLMEFVDRVVAFQKQIVYPVAAERQLFGFLALEDVKKRYRKNEWRRIQVRAAMREVREDHFVYTDAPVAEIRELLKINGLGLLGVVDKEGLLVGTIRRGRIRRRS